VPSLVAIEMLRERPLTGYGPGSFRAEYFDHKLLVDQKYRSLLPEKMSEWSETRMLSFGETHDEHLQVASELGLPGYVLFAAILVVIARRTRRRRAQTRPRGEFGALLALPAVVAFAVSVLAQFPLRLAAPLTTTLFVAAMIVAWTGNAEPENGEPEASA
jgi:O-antigen ligase